MIVQKVNMKVEDMVERQTKIKKDKRRARSMMQGLETYNGDLKESPLRMHPAPIKKEMPDRIITLDGIIGPGIEFAKARNLSRLAQTNVVKD